MAPNALTSDEGQFMFLISCIKYSKNGKPDFELVAQDRGIVSKGAAAKRFSRMMKTYGISLVEGGPRKSHKDDVESPPATDEDEKFGNVKGMKEGRGGGEAATDKKVSNSKKRKRGGNQATRKRNLKNVKIEPESDDDTEEENAVDPEGEEEEEEEV
ncbi:hypothetical protein ABW20_dc0101844 [Dactylellina cionopaga]|nr:hypothetical protein ABW20_dc0101844 [Dactylellina cionopaga]